MTVDSVVDSVILVDPMTLEYENAETDSAYVVMVFGKQAMLDFNALLLSLVLHRGADTRITLQGPPTMPMLLTTHNGTNSLYLQNNTLILQFTEATVWSIITFFQNAYIDFAIKRKKSDTSFILEEQTFTMKLTVRRSMTPSRFLPLHPSS